MDEMNTGDPDNVVRLGFGKKAGPVLTEDEKERASQKLRAFTELIDAGMVMVALDARRDGVRVPRRLSDSSELRLNFSLKFYIDDFAYDERGVRASLSFGGQPFFCDIPWTSVHGIQSQVTDQNYVWREDLPAERREAAERLMAMLALEESEKDAEGASDRGAPALQAVPAALEDAGEAQEPVVRPVLRLVRDDEG